MACVLRMTPSICVCRTCRRKHMKFEHCTMVTLTETKVLMERESANPEFAFMFNLRSPEHMYFRWRLYSLAQGMLSWEALQRCICLHVGIRWMHMSFSGMTPNSC
jgi:Surp module